MNNSFLLWSIPFFCVSIYHLAVCVRNKNKLADLTKAFLMPMLLFGYWGFIALSRGQSVLEQNTVLLSLGIIFGGMGDMYLLKQHETQNFVRGLLAFFIGHIFYLIVILSVFSFLPLPTSFIVIAIIVYLALVVATWFMNNCQKGPIGVAVVLYALLLVGINAISLFLLIGHYIQGGFAAIPTNITLLFIGSLVFLISDAALSRTIFVKEFPMHRFIVMVTYLAAQFLIVYSIAIN